MVPHAREAETTPEPATDPERSNKYVRLGGGCRSGWASSQCSLCSLLSPCVSLGRYP